jgi:uncharacterized protein YqgV (UPF0045/DUF77 family)
MNITVELSLYPLHHKYEKQIYHFIDKITAGKNITSETTAMSTLLTGDYDAIMSLISGELKAVFENQKAVCILKMSNGCIFNEQSE